MKAVIDRLNSLKETPDYEKIIRSGKQYTDTQFRHIFSKINSKIDATKRADWKSRFKWHRISEIYNIDDISIVHKIRPGDIEQGVIGDGYFMSTLRSIAMQQPFEIKKLFLTTEINTSGCYAMQLLVNGCYQTIVVDDFIPYDPNSKIEAFARKKTKNIWPILLEKAWAKINGSYEDITSGSSSEALKFLLPYPQERLESKDEEVKINKWDAIHDALSEQYMVICSSGDSETQESECTIEKLGIVLNHCYCITGQYTVDYKGRKEKLLKVSNPWNKQEWKGKWNDKDKYWNEDNKQKANFDRKADGEFYISFSDYIKYFDSTTICKLDPFYDQGSLTLKHKMNSYCLVKIELPVKTHLVIRVSQAMQRLFPKDAEYKPGFMRILVGKLTGDSSRPIEYVMGGFQSYSDLYSLESPDFVEKGTYYAYLEVNFNNKLLDQFGVGVLGYNLKISEVDQSEYPKFLKHGIKDYAKYHIDKFHSKEGEPNYKSKFYLGEKTAGYGFNYFENYSTKDTTGIETINYTQAKGIQFEKDQLKFVIETIPNTSQLLLFKRVEGSGSTNYSYNTYLKHSAKYLAKETLKNGKRGDINSSNIDNTKMFYYYLAHDFGYTFVFVNENKELKLDEYITFDKLENLQLTKADKEYSNNKPFWKFTVDPGMKVVKHLRKEVVDSGYSMSYQLSHEFLKPDQEEISLKEKLDPESLTDDEIIEIVLKRSDPYTFKCPKTGKPLKIGYRHYYFQTFYAWVFENKEKDYEFDGTFTFSLKNLKLNSSHHSDENNWNIKLKSNTQILKLMHTINKGEGVSFKVSMTYSIKSKY